MLSGYHALEAPELGAQRTSRVDGHYSSLDSTSKWHIDLLATLVLGATIYPHGYGEL